MLVTLENIDDCLNDIEHCPIKGFDTETSGTRWSDRLFAFIVSTSQQEYYFNFNDKADHLGQMPSVILRKDRVFPQIATTFRHGTWGAHNAKFDLQKIYVEGFGTPKKVHCTMISERLIRNDRMEYSLEAIAPIYGCEKDKTVDEYIMKNKLYTKVSIPGKQHKSTEKHFDQVPFEIMRKYGEMDAKIHRIITEKQLFELGV